MRFAHFCVVLNSYLNVLFIIRRLVFIFVSHMKIKFYKSMYFSDFLWYNLSVNGERREGHVPLWSLLLTKDEGVV